MRALPGKVALVTGASSGIGRSASFAFARESARVVVAGRRQNETEETAGPEAKQSPSRPTFAGVRN